MDEEKLNAVMQQLADQMREYNDNLSRFARSTGGTDKAAFFSKTEVDELSKSMANLKNLTVSELEALKGEKKYRGELTHAIKAQIDAEVKRKQITEALTNATKNAVSGINNFAKSINDISGDVSKLGSALQGMGAGFTEFSKNFGVKMQAAAVGVQAFTTIMSAALDQTNKLLKAFDDVSEVGGTTRETSESIRKLGREAGYTVDNLPKFTQIIRNLNGDLIGLGGSANAGLKTFSKIATVGNQTYEAFNRLGVSQEQLTEAQAGYVRQAIMSNAIAKKSPEELRKASLDYVETLVKLRDLSGQSLKQQQSAIEAAMAQRNFNAYINSRELQIQDLKDKTAKMADGVEKKRIESEIKTIEEEVKGKKAAAIVASTYDEQLKTAILQGISTAGETVMSEGVARAEALQGLQISSLNRLINQGKGVEALAMFSNSLVDSAKNQTRTFGPLASIGDQFTPLADQLMFQVKTLEQANRLNTMSNEKRLEEFQQIFALVEKRKIEGKTVDEFGNEVRDVSKDTQNFLLTLGKTVGTFKDDVLAAVNPFTATTGGAALASTALAGAASYAAYKLASLGKGLGALGGIGTLGGSSGAPPVPSGGGGGTLGKIGGFAKGLLGKVALPILAGTTLYDAAKGFGADSSAGFGSKLLNAGSSALSGLSFGMLGSSAEEIKKRAEAGAGKLGESATTTTVEGGQKAVNVNVVGSIPLNVNIEKVLDPLFRMAQAPKGQGPSSEPLPPGISVPGVTKSFDEAKPSGTGNVSIVIPPIDKSKPFEGSQKEFTDRMQSTLLEQAKKLNLQNPEIIASLGAAQSALETGYGKHLAGGNNYFGIKAKPGDQNASVLRTQEWDASKGQYVTKQSSFRKYGSMEESVEDYIKFLLENPRYKEVLASKSIEEAIRAIQNAGYATDPRYETKIRGILGRMGGSPSNFAQGGMILGPGSSTSDSIPAFNSDTGQPIALSTGEYVLPASVTSMLGRGYLDSLISSPNTLKRQGGGSIPGGGGKQIIASSDLGEGMREVLYSDGSRELSGGFGTRFFDASGKLVKTRTPNFAGLYKEIHADGGVDTHYAAGPMSFSQYASGRRSASYNLGMAKISSDTEKGNMIDIFNEDRTERLTSIEQVNSLLEQYKNDDSEMKTVLESVKEIFQQMMDKNESLFTEMNSTLKDVVGELEESNSTQEDILNYSRI